ncbi:DUF1508 domain-containing protein [Lactobacillus reuteri]|uniref:DUF1508 domain-containing protein n=1 Tax=Limosilactobacillus reuteri TaxID=1598 RepID=A0A517D6F7_LIMRT|nr:DUF1508 domain-containing protein [Limosilactobacillus reuteri]MRH08392.1 DUF1508 domain-containing protein [Limosilactobacillus reuteri]NMV51641.1 DUF1508 domain-containing protein [Limosilactobacillus reuteri]NMV55837.1 DUF1508 domain-containing protein [Limosilactobacillus reuteri]NMV64741.1 DUF1508 domain-containing protein [Limosilactobacillus reuteri]QDR72944.1 DUF1508 domain-containing protein [Limosilactobacillus reuteri]
MYFSIRKSSDYQYYFVIKSDNNEVVATSETYILKESAEHTINVIKNGINPDTLVVDVTDD